MRHVKPRLCALLACLTLLIVGCGGSDPSQPPVSTTTSESITEAEALAASEAVIIEQGLSTQDLEAKPALLFGEWQVSYEPVDSDELRGGFLVILDAVTAELTEVVQYQ